MRLAILLAVIVLLSACRSARAQDFVPFVIPATQNEKSLIAFPSRAIEPNAPRLVARDGHFFAGDRRVRIWGVNLCFAANFPTHADAERLAARLAAFGINSVRHHHMDGTTFPRGIWDAMDERLLSAEGLERLDYLIGQLARRGIYSNLNLHVSRTHSRVLKMADTSALGSFDKMVDLFTPELIDAQKKYARDLLKHVNPYRRMRLADDPAVAFVEINNEDSLFMWGWENKLRNLPEFYARLLRGLYGQWLLKRYGSAEALAGAWGAGAMPLGENLLSDVRALAPAGRESPKTWTVELHAPCRAAAAPAPGDANAVRIEIAQIDDASWHIQFRQFGVELKGGQYYTLLFRGRAQRPRDIYVGVGQHQGPWAGLGLGQSVKLTQEWKAFRLGFVAKADEKNARPGFSLGQSADAVELAGVELRPGGKEGLGRGEDPKAGTVEIMGAGGAGETEARTLDRMRFLAETEKAYFDSMRDYVKKDLGCKALVAGTIVFGPLGMWAQSDMDYLDGHAYWHHPNFPHRPWDPSDWTVQQEAMVDHPAQSTLYPLAAQRLAGKPYTVSEYNHPAPNDYQAECVPFIASFAAAQDWDGVWLFAYSHSAGWDRQAFSSFFDIDANPAKWGFVPAGAAIFKPGSEHLMEGDLVVPVGKAGDLASLCRLHLKHGSDLAGLLDGQAGKEAWRSMRVYLSLKGESQQRFPFRDVPAAIWWWAGPDGNTAFGRLFAADFRFQIGVGRPGGQTDLNPLPKAFLWERPAFAAAVLTSLDGGTLADSRKVLLTACGRCENTGMQFTPDRRSVGRNWGKAPVQIEPVEGVLSLDFAKEGKWTCHALKPDGSAGEEVPITRPPDKNGKPGVPTITLSARYGTMWYLLERP